MVIEFVQAGDESLIILLGNISQYLQETPNVKRKRLLLGIAEGLVYLHGLSFIVSLMGSS